MEVGYHYTSGAAWERIRHEGLRPTVLSEQLRADKGLRDVDGLGHTPVICFFPERRTEEPPTAEDLRWAHWGQLLWTFARRETPHVVLLELDYDPADLFVARVRGEPADISHDGRIDTPYNSFVYHDKEPLYLLTRPVPPDHVRWLEEWRLDL